MWWSSWRSRPARDQLARRYVALLAAFLLLGACSPFRSTAQCDGGGDTRPAVEGYALQATAPAIADGAIYLDVVALTYQGGLGVANASREEIVALRTSDGGLLWQHPDPLVGQPPFPDLGEKSLVLDDGVLILSGQLRMAALRPSDGTLLWQLTRGSTRYAVPVPPVVDQDVLYASDVGGLYAARISDGQVLWQVSPLALQVSGGPFSTLNQPFSRPVVAEGTVYVGSRDGRVVAVRSRDGAILWQSPVVSAAFALPQPEALAGGQLYVSGSDGGLLRLRATDGGLEGPVPHLPQTGLIDVIVTNGGLYFASTQDMLYTLWTPAGKALWTAPIGSAPGHVTAVDDGMLYVDGQRADLYAVRLVDGAVLWSYHGQWHAVSAGSGHVYFSQAGSVSLCPQAVQPVNVLSLSEQDGSVSWTTPVPGLPGVPLLQP